MYKDRHGLAATVKVNGVQHAIRFPPGTPLKTIRARRDEVRASLRTLPAADRHTLTHDAGRCLDPAKNNTLFVSRRDRHRDLAVMLRPKNASYFGHGNLDARHGSSLPPTGPGCERIGVGVTTGSGVVTLAFRPGPSTDGSVSVRQVPVQREGYNEGSERGCLSTSHVC